MDIAMLRLRPSAIVVCTLLCITGNALAQTPPQSDAVKALVGTWEISNADRDKICMVTFHPQAVPRGLKLEFDKACGEVFPVTTDIAAWTLTKDGLRLLDAKGKAMLDLDEVERDIFEGERPGEGRYFMQNLASARALPTAEQIFGDWGVSRGADTPICIITFFDRGVADNFALRLKPGCDASVTGFNPTSWRMERGELLVTSPKSIWRFEEAGQAVWRRVPEGVEPLWLVRQ